MFLLHAYSSIELKSSTKDSDRVAEYDMKLMDIDTDALGIPDTDYEACVTMSATEFSRIIRDLAQLGESVRVDVSKEGVRFASDGEAANAVVLLKQTDAARRRYAGWGSKKEEEEDQKSGSSKNKIKKEKVKKEEIEEGNEDEGGDDAEEENGKAESDKNSDGEAEREEEENEEDEDEEESSNKKKRKRPSASKDKKGTKRAKKSEDDGGDSGGVAIQMSQAVSLTFSLKYLVNFTKGGSLIDVVQLKLHSEVPLLVSGCIF